MNEKEWLGCEDPLRMLRSAHRSRRCRKAERVWRLLGCAAARRVWDDCSVLCRRGVETAERFADGGATVADMEEADRQVLYNERVICPGYGCARWTLWGPWRGHDTLFKSVTAGIDLAAQIAGPGEARRQCDLIRDLFGNPFRPATLDPAWRTADVLSLARAAYEERTLPTGTLGPDRLGLLADALEDAGCTSADILVHLRGPGAHVRGCWAVDLVLGRP